MMLLAVVVALLPAATSGAQDKVTIRITTWAGVDEAAEFQEIIDEVNASQDAFEIIHEPKPADYMLTLQTALAGGEAADLMWLGLGDMAIAYEDVLLDFSPYLEGDDRSAANPDDYFPEVWAAGVFDGGVYGMPWIAQPVVLYYNQDIFDEMGVEYPNAEWTWDDFKQAAMDLTNEEHYGFTMIDGWPPVELWVYSFGGELVNEDLTEAPVDSQEVMDAVNFWASMIWNEEMAPSQETIAEEGFEAMMRAGRVAMFIGGAADDYERSTAGTVGVSVMPKGPAGTNVTTAWIGFTAINADTEHPQEAYDAMVLLTEGIHNWKPSPRISHANVEHLVASIPYKADTAEEIIAALPNMRPEYRVFPGVGEFMWNIWRAEYTRKVALGEGTAEDFAPDVRILLEDVLAAIE
jgi:multiple sugar transport system substrate-binding protein